MLKAIIIVATFATATQAEENSFQRAYDFCWTKEQQNSSFVANDTEVSTGPIVITGEEWTYTWLGDDTVIEGDMIEVLFENGTVRMKKNEYPLFPDFVLKIQSHTDEGSVPFAVRHEGTMYMIAFYPATENEEAWCYVDLLQ